MRRHRFHTVAGIAAAVLALGMTAAFAGATWGPAPGADTTVVGHDGTWLDGPPAIVQSGSALVAVLNSDVDPETGRFAFEDKGRYMGAYYTRSTNDGGTWSTPVRLNPADQHAERVSVAANGQNVCAVYETQRRYYATGYAYTFDNSQPRYNFVRCSSDSGQSWDAAQQLPGQTKASRGDYPYIAAANGNFYVVVTNTKSGAIWLWRSTDNGSTWSQPTSVGTTTIRDTGVLSYVGGYSGLPAVGAAGSHVVVAWMTNTQDVNGRLLAKVSTDNGATFAGQVALHKAGASANFGYPNLKGAGDRIAAAWTTKSGGFVRIYDTDTGWEARRQFASFPDNQAGVDGRYNDGGMGAMPLLRGTSVVGVVWTECNETSRGICIDNYPADSDRDAKMQLVYRESADDGATWGTASVVELPAGKFVQNDWADGIFVGTTPYAYYSSHNAAYGFYNVKLEVCAGC